MAALEILAETTHLGCYPARMNDSFLNYVEMLAEAAVSQNEDHQGHAKLMAYKEQYLSHEL